MAAKKRKSTLEEPLAKRQRLNINRKSVASFEIKTASPVAIKFTSLLNKGLKQSKKVLKASLKPTASIKKAAVNAAKKPFQTNRTSDQSKQIELEFKRRSSRNKRVEKVHVKKTVLMSGKLLSSKTATRTSRVSKSLRNNPAKVTESAFRAVSAKTDKNSITSKTLSQLNSAANGKKVSLDNSNVKSARYSVQKSLILSNKTPLQILHLENTSVTNDCRRNGSLPVTKTVKRSTSVATKKLHEMNAKKKRLEHDLVSMSPGRNDTHIVTKKHSDENHIDSGTVVRRKGRDAITGGHSKTHRLTKSHSKPKVVKKPVLEKKSASDAPKSKPVNQNKELQDMRSQQQLLLSDVPVKSRQKRGMKEKVLQVKQNHMGAKDLLHKDETAKHPVSKESGMPKGKTNTIILTCSVEPKDKKLKTISKTTRKLKDIKHTLFKSPKSKVSKTDLELEGGSSPHPKGLPKSKQIPKSKVSKTGLKLDAGSSPCPKDLPKSKKIPKSKVLETDLELDGGSSPRTKGLPKSKKIPKSKISPQQSLHVAVNTLEQSVPPASCPKPKKKTLKEKIISKDKVALKKVVSPKLKRSKASKLQPSVVAAISQPDDEPKSKRVSILELCEEIAGEIESDTVEVKKEVPDAASAIEATKAAEELLQQEMPEGQKRTEEESKQLTPTKCFFPSKKLPVIKNKLKGKTSPTIKNSRPTEMKPMKANHVIRNNALNLAALPNLELIRRNILVSSKEVQARTKNMTALRTSMVSPGTTGRLLVMQNKEEDQSPNPKTVCSAGVESREVLQPTSNLPVTQLESQLVPYLNTQEEDCLEDAGTKEIPLDATRPPKRAAENGLLEPPLDELFSFQSFSLRLDSSPESSPKKVLPKPRPAKQAKLDLGDCDLESAMPKLPVCNLTAQAPENVEKRVTAINHSSAAKSSVALSEANLQQEIKKLKEAQKDGGSQLTIDAGQKRFGAISCHVCGMLYTASNPEDETQHILFHRQFVSAVRYVGWKKERIVAEFPDGKIIMIFPDDPKYALKKVQEIREMVDNDLGFQQVPLRIHSRTKTLLFISNDKKVAGCLIAEHIQWGYRVIDEKMAGSNSEREKAIFESQKAWCCSTSPEPALCGISRIWVFRMMRRQKIASRMIECLRSNFIYGSYLSKEEIAFSDPTPDGKLFATQYCGTGQFLVYNFISGRPDRT